MAYRIVGRAEDRVDGILLDSARQWGVETAAPYHRLLLAAMAAFGEDPMRSGSRPVPQLVDVRTFHLHSARRLVPPQYRVGQPRHLLVYRVAPDGVVEILTVVHDRMHLIRAVRRAQREADG
jgi:toxin ParE1/3/4